MVGISVVLFFGKADALMRSALFAEKDAGKSYGWVFLGGEYIERSRLASAKCRIFKAH